MCNLQIGLISVTWSLVHTYLFQLWKVEMLSIQYITKIFYTDLEVAVSIAIGLVYKHMPSGAVHLRVLCLHNMQCTLVCVEIFGESVCDRCWRHFNLARSYSCYTCNSYETKLNLVDTKNCQTAISKPPPNKLHTRCMLTNVYACIHMHIRMHAYKYTHNLPTCVWYMHYTHILYTLYICMQLYNLTYAHTYLVYTMILYIGIAYHNTAGISQYLKICYLHPDLVHSLCILWLVGHWTLSSKGMHNYI